MQSAEYLFWIGFAAAGAAILFAGVQAWRLFRSPKGEEGPRPVEAILRRSLNAYCLRHYGALLLLAVLIFGGLWALAYVGVLEDWYLPFAFLSGCLLPALAGFLGMRAAAWGQVRAAAGAREGLDKALRAALTSGTVAGFLGAGLALLELTGWFFVLRYSAGCNAARTAGTMLTFGLGAAFLALFSRVGSGIFLSGTDLAAGGASRGSVTLPPEHFYNPASMACLTGRLAGGVQALTSELYSAQVMALLCALALGEAAFAQDSLGWSAMLLPLAVTAAGALCSLICCFLIRVREGSPLLRRFQAALLCAAGLTGAAAAPVTFVLMGSWSAWVPTAAGLLAGVAILFYSRWSVSGDHKPVQRMAAPAETDPASSVLSGLTLGMRRSLLPALILGGAALVSFLAVGGLPAPGLDQSAFARGSYGVALCAVGMLSTIGIVLSVGACGGAAGSVAGMAFMTDMDEGVKARAFQLKDLGADLSAMGKGLTGAGSVLASASLLICWVELLGQENALPGALLTAPQLLVGVVVGGGLAFLFASLVLSGTQQTARAGSKEIRQQFRMTRGILSGKVEPDHVKCVSVCANTTLWAMAAPLLLALGAPLLVGVGLGPAGAVGLLLGVMAGGYALGVFLTGAGSIWDAVRRLLRADPHADEDSDRSRAAALGDVVGGPLRNGAGPALYSLIRLCAALSAALSVLMVRWDLFTLLG